MQPIQFEKIKMELKTMESNHKDEDFKLKSWNLAQVIFPNHISLLNQLRNSTVNGKIEKIVLMIHKIVCIDEDIGVLLKDPTGEIYATLHKEILNSRLSLHLQHGTVLELRHVSLFKPRKVSSQVYLNVPLKRIYSCIDIHGFRHELHSLS